MTHIAVAQPNVSRLQQVRNPRRRIVTIEIQRLKQTIATTHRNGISISGNHEIIDARQSSALSAQASATLGVPEFEPSVTVLGLGRHQMATIFTERVHGCGVWQPNASRHCSTS